MASELDIRLQAIMNRLTQAGGLFETGVIARADGLRLPAFTRAPATLPALFNLFCALHHDREFLVDGDLRLTFGEARALANRAAAGLIASHDVRRGDRIGIAASNSASWIVAYMAVLIAGGCATLFNGWWTGEELAGAARLSGCTLVLADAERAERLRQHGTEARIVVFDHGDPAAGLAALAASNDNLPPPPAAGPDAIATILFTSGSTGMPKAAFSSHRAVVQAAMGMAAQWRMVAIEQAEGAHAPAPPQREAALLCVPLFHATGQVAVLLQSFILGRTLVIMSRWDATEAMRLIERERITFFTGVPLMNYEIATHPDRARYDLSSCIFFGSGGSAQPPAHVRRIRDASGHAYALQGYGLTETNSVGCINFTENYLAKPESTGPASRPLVEIAILGSTGERLPAGMAGEIAIRSICNFGGYWNDPAATRAVLRPDGFVLTGDIGQLDQEGYLFLVDRKKDIIIRGGENIACGEVEQALYAHPGIAEASVFGLPDPRYGEVPVAVYQTKRGMAVREDELRRHLQERIAAFKIPVHFWRESKALPRLGTQKVDKQALKARYSRQWEAATSGS